MAPDLFLFLSMAKRIRQNIILFFVWLVLWWLIFLYLDNHPGEKASIMPSLQILWHKALWLWFRVVGKNPESIAVKATLIRNFDELAYLVESNITCIEPSTIDEIQKYRDEVNALSYDIVIGQQYLYYTRASNLKKQIDDACAN